jgi:MurNAc alpha-1-phosphate uridylyltransferase
MTLPIAILAGGLATRMMPLTQSTPKALLDVAGKPFIHWQLEYLKQQGANEVVLCIGHLGELIEASVGDGTKFGLNVSYSFDGPSLLGTGGSIKRALPYLGEVFMILYGDSFLPIDFKLTEITFTNQNKPALMTILKNDNRWDKSNVQFKDHEIIEYNKKKNRSDMEYIDYGLSILSANCIYDFSESDVFDLSDLYHDLSMKKNLAGLEVKERFFEIGSETGLKETRNYFKLKGKP